MRAPRLPLRDTCVVILTVCACALVAYLGVLVVNSIQQGNRSVKVTQVAIEGRNASSARFSVKVNALETKVDTLLARSVRSQRQRDRQLSEIQALRRELAQDHRSTQRRLGH